MPGNANGVKTVLSCPDAIVTRVCFQFLFFVFWFCQRLALFDQKVNSFKLKRALYLFFDYF